MLLPHSHLVKKEKRAIVLNILAGISILARVGSLERLACTFNEGFDGGGPVFSVELSLPEARSALEAFAANRMAALEAFSRSIRLAVADGLNQLMNAEMAVFLGKASQKGNRRNGHTMRE